MKTSYEHTLTLSPALHNPIEPTWDGAVWIGEVWVDAIQSADTQGDSAGVPVRCRLVDAQGYRRAHLLVRTDGRSLGFVELEVSDGDVDFDQLKQLVAHRVAVVNPSASVNSIVEHRQPTHVTVVICTRDRVELLKTALKSVLAVDYPDFDVIVVDNAPATTLTRDYVLALADPRVTLVEEPVAGLSRARNAGLLAATGDIVAFTDDDVVVDRFWLRALVDGFARGDSVGCVSGTVPAGEIRTPAQAYFEGRVGWSDSTEARVYDMAHPPEDVPMFPFAVRCYGAGANFAVDRHAARELGGFDETLGAGVATGGGEDLDLFFRFVHSGSQLVNEPAAIVWHRHRADNAALITQTNGYGLGLGAWLAKIAHDPVTARLAVKTVLLRAPSFIRYLRAASDEIVPTRSLAGHLPPDIGNSTWRQLVRGAMAYRRAQRDPCLREPLLTASSRRSVFVERSRIEVS